MVAAKVRTHTETEEVEYLTTYVVVETSDRLFLVNHQTFESQGWNNVEDDNSLIGVKSFDLELSSDLIVNKTNDKVIKSRWF